MNAAAAVGKGISGSAWAFGLLVGTGVLWGTIGVVSKLVADGSSLDAISITWLRSAIAGPVCLAAAWLILGPDLFRAPRRVMAAMVAFGGVLILYQWLYLAAIERIGVSAATLISLCGAPVIVAVASTFVLREKMTRAIPLALAGAIAGTILLIGRPEAGTGRNTLIGAILAVGCAAGIAVHVMGLRSLANKVHPLQSLSIGFTVGAVLFTPVALIHGVSFNQPMDAWLWLVYLGVVPSTIAYLFYQRGLQDVTAAMASIVTMIEPLVAAILAWFIFDERLGFWGWIGGALLISSIALLSRHSIRRSRQSQQLLA
ncbi:EamA family transporter [soil metagenome]